MILDLNKLQAEKNAAEEQKALDLKRLAAEKKAAEESINNARQEIEKQNTRLSKLQNILTDLKKHYEEFSLTKSSRDSGFKRELDEVVARKEEVITRKMAEVFAEFKPLILKELNKSSVTTLEDQEVNDAVRATVLSQMDEELESEYRAKEIKTDFDDSNTQEELEKLKAKKAAVIKLLGLDPDSVISKEDLMQRVEQEIDEIQTNLRDLKLQTPEGKEEIRKGREAYLDERLEGVMRVSSKDSPLTQVNTLLGRTGNLVTREVVESSDDRDRDAKYLADKALDKIILAADPKLDSYKKAINDVREIAAESEEYRQQVAAEMTSFNNKWSQFRDNNPTIAEHMEYKQRWKRDSVYFSDSHFRAYAEAIFKAAMELSGTTYRSVEGAIHLSPTTINERTTEIPNYKALTEIVEVLMSVMDRLNDSSEEELQDRDTLKSYFDEAKTNLDAAIKDITGDKYAGGNSDSAIRGLKRPLAPEIRELFSVHNQKTRYGSVEKVELSPDSVQRFTKPISEYVEAASNEIKDKYQQRVEESVKLSWLEIEHQDDIDGREAVQQLRVLEQKQKKATDDLGKISGIEFRGLPEHIKQLPLSFDRNHFAYDAESDFSTRYEDERTAFYERYNKLSESLRREIKSVSGGNIFSDIQSVLNDKEKKLTDELAADKQPKAGLLSSKKEKIRAQNFKDRRNDHLKAVEDLSNILDNSKNYQELSRDHDVVVRILNILSSVAQADASYASTYQYRGEFRINTETDYTIESLYTELKKEIQQVIDQKLGDEAKKAAEKYQARQEQIDKVR